ncbi:MAG TPA: glycosyltransferase family 39 protein [Pyrinomonadaceae bacterium]|jgi:4-amino-4-deoxy-L-arabinose transferase-like glycosyltransferase
MSEITKTEDQKPKAELFWLLFALIVVAAYLTGLTIPLVGPDEPRYAEVAREMFARGDWVTPRLGGFDWFEKPALLYWLQIFSYHLFGVSEFAARFGSALFGLGTIASLWVLGKKTEKIENPEFKVQNLGNWLALVAASSFGLIVFSRGASFDIILTFPVTAALVSFFVFDLTQRRKDAKAQSFTGISALVSFYFFVGVAVLAKGLVGIVFPYAIVAFYYLLSRRFPPKAFIFSLFWGTILSSAVACAWYLPMYRANGWKFIDEFFVQHHFQRYTSNKYQHPQPFYFFFWVLPLMTLPWLPFFFATLWNLIKNLISRKDAKTQNQEITTQNSRLTTFALAWLLVPLAFFSLSGSKLPGYILPAVPAALILAALSVRRFAAKSNARATFVKTLAVLVIVGAALLAQFFIGDFLHEETVKHLIDTAHAKGYRTEKVLTLHTISHSAEFYGSGRLVRDSDGKQKRLYGVSQVIEEMRRENAAQALVIVPIVYQNQLLASPLVDAELLDDNGELAIVFVKIR